MNATYTTLHSLSTLDNTFDAKLTLTTVKVICEVLTGIILATTIWILFCMVEYGRRFKKWNYRTKKGRIYIYCFVAILVGIPKLTVSLLIYHANNDWQCHMLGDLGMCITSLSTISVFLFLWFRQWNVHENKQLQSLMPQCVKGFSNLILIVIVLSNTGFPFYYVYENEYFLDDLGCRVVETQQGKSTGIYRDWLQGLHPGTFLQLQKHQQ